MDRKHIRKAFKNRNFKVFWQFILRIIRSCSIHKQHYNHLKSSRFWKLLQNLLNFLQAGKKKPSWFPAHGKKAIVAYGEKPSYSLGKDICFLCCISKHTVEDILPPVCSKP